MAGCGRGKCGRANSWLDMEVGMSLPLLLLAYRVELESVAGTEWLWGMEDVETVLAEAGCPP